jgi:hypothetical protein
LYSREKRAALLAWCAYVETVLAGSDADPSPTAYRRELEALDENRIPAPFDNEIQTSFENRIPTT